MRIRRHLWCAVLLLCVLLTGILPVKADTQEYRQQLLRYYCSNQKDARIETCLQRLEEEDPLQGAAWRQILSDWDRLNHAGYSSHRTLKDGLAEDDSLCIVVFGYGLNKNGSMKPELFDRLKIALQAARQYPNAYIALTGGETSGIKGISEAAVMAIWLMNNDIPEERIILENKSLSTTENGKNTYELVARDYPHVKQFAVITSDYHVAFAATMLQTASTYESAMLGNREIPVVAGASCATSTPVCNDLSTQAWGISILTGTRWTTVKAEVQTETEPEYDTDAWFE